MAGVFGFGGGGRGGLGVVLAAALLLPSCVTMTGGSYGGSGYSYYGAPSYRAPSYGASSSYYGRDRDVRDLNNKGRAGLERGCANRYGSGSQRYWQCMDGGRNSAKALRQGCREMFGWSKRRMQSCMSW